MNGAGGCEWKWGRGTSTRYGKMKSIKSAPGSAVELSFASVPLIQLQVAPGGSPMEKSGGCFFAHRARSLILFVHVSLPRLLGGVDPAAEGQSFQPSKELVRTTGTGLLGSMRYAYFYRPSRSEITRIMLPSFWRARLPRQGKRRSIAFQESGYGPSDGWMKQVGRTS